MVPHPSSRTPFTQSLSLGLEVPALRTILEHLYVWMWGPVGLAGGSDGPPADWAKGMGAPWPTTVCQARTRHRLTTPLRTAGSAAANASVVDGESARNSRTADPSVGSASDPPRINS